MYYLEFPSGPIAVGDQPVHNLATRSTAFGQLLLLTPLDCIKDRLAAFYHWNDKQALSQALNVASRHQVNLEEIAEWSKWEGMTDRFETFRKQLEATE